MSKGAKVWLIVGISLVLVVCIFVGVMAMLNWDFSKLSTVKYETNNYNLTEDYQNLSIRTQTANIEFIPSADGTTSVVCYEAEKVKHTVAIVDGTLVIERNDTRKWFEYIGFDFHNPKITVYLPKGEYGELDIKASTGHTKLSDGFTFESVSVKASTGNIRVTGISAGAINLSVSTGDINITGMTCSGDIRIKVSTGKTNLTNVQCKNLFSDGDTGSITLTNVLASEKFDIERDTGYVKLNSCDAAELYIETDTGDVTGTLLSEKVFIVETDTGRIDVPRTITGGRCEIETNTGDVRIRIE